MYWATCERWVTNFDSAEEAPDAQLVMVTTMPDEAALGKVSRTIPTKFLSVSLKEANLILENHRYLGGLEAGKPRICQSIALE